MNSAIFVSMLAASSLLTSTLSPPVAPHRANLVEAWLDALMDHQDIPGAVVAITAPGTTPYVRGFGYVDRDNEIKMSSDSRVRVCSVSKLFTAVTAASIEQTELIRFDDPSVFGFIEFTHEDEHAFLTLYDVLRHTSGLREEASWPYFIDFDYPSVQALLGDTESFELRAAPGTEYRYSNLGYGLTGIALERATSTSFADLLRSRVLDPLSLDSTGLDYEPGFESSGYTIRSSSAPRELFAPYSFAGLAPAGGLVTTGGDLATLTTWLGRVLTGDDTLADIPVDPERLREMATRPEGGSVERRGSGFNFYQGHQGTHFTGHGGYCSGFRSIVLVDPETGRGISVVINVNDGNANELAYAIYDLAFAETTNLEGSDRASSPFNGIYRRAGMPEIYAMSATPNETLEVMPVFSFRPVNGLDTYRAVDECTFENASGRRVHFDRAEEGSPLRFWIEEFHYLTRDETGADREARNCVASKG